MKRLRLIHCFVLSTVMMLSLMTGCQTKPTQTEPPKPTTVPAQMSDIFKEAVGLGIAWEELAWNLSNPITGSDLVKLMENALTVLGKSESDEYLDKFYNLYGKSDEVQRYQLAKLLYGVYNDVIAGHDFQLSAGAIRYEVGGTYTYISIWDCPDISEIESLLGYDAMSCEYAISAFDRVNGDKLMTLFEDWTFRPTEKVTVESAVETVFHFVRSFEDDPVYCEVDDDRASQHTIDYVLYSGETTLPDATNQDLPNWRGCNISYNSMLIPGALCWNPDDVFVEGNLDYLKEVGANFVHLYLSWSYFQGPDFTCDSKVNLSRLAQLDEIISWCMERDIHIQLVFNDVPNLDGNNIDLDTLGEQVHAIVEDESIRDTVTDFWRMLARRYADIPNNYLSFNLMNEFAPKDDANYLWVFKDSVSAIWEESPGRVVVADVHASNVTGESMAELGCALSYHYYNLRDISIVSPEMEEIEPGFYENIRTEPRYVNAIFYGPKADTSEALKIRGDLGEATLSVAVKSLIWFDSTMCISADGQKLYEGMESYTYDEATDYISVNSTITVTVPENVTNIEISCAEGSGFEISNIDLTLANGDKVPIQPIFVGWEDTKQAEIIVSQDGNCTSTYQLELENIPGIELSLSELIAIGEKHGVDVMVGECGFFEGGEPMVAGIRQEVIQKLFLNQIDTFERLGLAWCFEYIGRYALVTPAPYLEGIEYRDLENSPYYVNLEMDEFFKQIMVGNK